MRMVRWAVKPKRLDASCCSVEVMNGGAGLRLRERRVMAATFSLPLACSAIVSRT
jgi:hypothetical protein